MIPARLSFIFKPATVLIGATKIIFWPVISGFGSWTISAEKKKKETRVGREKA